MAEWIRGKINNQNETVREKCYREEEFTLRSRRHPHIHNTNSTVDCLRELEPHFSFCSRRQIVALDQPFFFSFHLSALASFTNRNITKSCFDMEATTCPSWLVAERTGHHPTHPRRRRLNSIVR